MGDERSATAAGTIMESSNTEWTDEKHSLYLNSVEESFVNQLYNHDYCLNNFHDWLPNTRKDRHSSRSTLSGLCPGQFKVKRRRCPEEIRFERTQPQTSIENESHDLVLCPWIKHFRSFNTGDHWNERTSCRCISSSMQLPSFSRNLYQQVYVDTSIEVSDQNFADNELEIEKKTKRARKKKRLKITGVTDASGKDQVVPSRTSLLLPSEQICASLDSKYEGSACQMQKT